MIITEPSGVHIFPLLARLADQQRLGLPASLAKQKGLSPGASALRITRKKSGGGRIRTDDLEVMSLASYLAAPPRVI